MTHSKEIYDFWEKVKKEKNIEENFVDAWAFGDNPELKDELLGLILNGKKRTSTSLLKESEIEGYPRDEVGQYNIILDGRNKPAAVIKTVSVTPGKLHDVTEEHAYYEGEGDRSVETYLAEHIKYYKRIGEASGFEFNTDMDVEFVRFELVYP
jgi:uncharacterized protein YhfF